LPIPTPGRIVLYTLGKQDADEINKRRTDAQTHLQYLRENSNGVQVHVGNPVYEGDVYPLVITRVWSRDNPTAAVNGQVMLDGNDLFWATSVQVGTGPRTFAWPERPADPFARIA